MKKLIITLSFVTFLLIQLKGQQIHELKELQKFSYLIMHVKNDIPTNFSSGFFIQKNKKLFLVSAYHSITQWNVYLNRRETPLLDTLLIRLFRRADKKVYYYRMNVRHILNDSKMQYWFEKPDVYCLEVPIELSETYEINKISNINNTYSEDLGEINRVMFYGFPHARYMTHTRQLDTLKSSLTIGNLFTGINNKLYYPYLKKLDEINYNILITTPELALNGASGSPAFFEYINKKTTQRTYLFGGLVSGGDTEQKSSTIVRPQYVVSN